MKRCLVFADIRQAAFEDQLHRAMNWNARHVGVAIDPTIRIQLCVLGDAQLFQVERGPHLHTRLRKRSRHWCNARWGLARRFFDAQKTHDAADAQKNQRAGQKQNQRNQKHRRDVDIFFFVRVTFCIHAGTATTNRGSFIGTSCRASSRQKKIASQIPPIPSQAAGAIQVM